MPTRWYRVYRTTGSPQNQVQRISAFVRNNELGDEIPHLRYERPSGRRRRGEFYLFVGMISEEAPPDVIEQLDALRFGQYIGDVEYSDIKEMASSEIDISDYARTIPYQLPDRTRPEDPFDMYAEPESTAAWSSGLRDSFNKLLFWLSATGAGSWQVFRRIYEVLGLSDSGLAPRQVARRLRLLGHIQYYDKGSKWTICPACLVSIRLADIEGSTYFLSGQRTPALIRALEQVATVNINSQASLGAPDCIRLVLESDDYAKLVAEDRDIAKVCRVYVASEASLRLAKVLPDLTGYMSGLTAVSVVPSLYDTDRWSGGDFQPHTFDGSAGMYRLTPKLVQQETSQFTLFYEPDQGRWLQGDWYGLRYLARTANGEVCEPRLDHESNRLALRAGFRWPDFYERSLVLASGVLPTRQKDWLYFEDIFPTLARTLSHKLSATLVEEGQG